MSTPSYLPRTRFLPRLLRGLLLVFGLIACLGLLIASGLPGLPRPPWKRSNRIETYSGAEKYAHTIQYVGQVAYSVERQGQLDIDLLNSARGRTGSTVSTQALLHSPANEFAPAWSEDGRWLYYLSDATNQAGGRGKTEIFAFELESGRQVQVSNAPQIEWSGPLYPSPIYRWDWNEKIPVVAVLGAVRQKDAQGGLTTQTGVYLVPLEGEDRTPLLLPGTMDVVEPLRFNWTYDHLLFSRSDGVLLRYDLEERDSFLLNGEQLQRGMAPVPGGFDWNGKDDRSTVVTLASGEPPEGEVGVEVRRLAFSFPGMYGDAVDDRTRIAENKMQFSGRVGSVQAIFADNFQYILALQDGNLDGSGPRGCLGLHIYDFLQIPVPPAEPQLFPEVCIDPLPLGFSRSFIQIQDNDNHRYNASWLLFSAREPGTPEPNATSLYAVLLFHRTSLTQLNQIRRLPVPPNEHILPGSLAVRPPVYNTDAYYPLELYPAPGVR